MFSVTSASNRNLLVCPNYGLSFGIGSGQWDIAIRNHWAIMASDINGSLIHHLRILVLQNDSQALLEYKAVGVIMFLLPVSRVSSIVASSPYPRPLWRDPFLGP